MRTPIEALRLLVGANRTYTIRLACSADDVRAAQALRFAVFNLELNEGLEESYCTGLDVDRFDPVCDHLLVEHADSKEVVGTYRLQTGTNAGDKLGRLALTIDGLRERDLSVLRECCEHEVPVVTVMSGGYGKDINDTIEIHCNTIRAVKEVFESRVAARRSA